MVQVSEYCLTESEHPSWPWPSSPDREIINTPQTTSDFFGLTHWSLDKM